MNAFRRHMLEMVLSMVIPMTVLAALFFVVLPGVGLGDLRPGSGSAWSFLFLPVAVLGMTLPMVWFMRRRGHAWRDVREMTLAMFVPLVLLVPLVRVVLPRAGVELAPAVMLPLAFAAMTFPMILVMLWRRDRYDHAVHTGSGQHRHPL